MTVPEGCILVELPNGSSFFYNDAQHSYWIRKEDGSRGKRLASASTLSKPADWDPGALLNWAAKETANGVAELYARDSKVSAFQPWLLEGESITAALRREKRTHNDRRDKKATVGTNVHTVLELLAAGTLRYSGAGVHPLPAGVSEEEEGYVRAVLCWWAQRKPVVFQSEQFVYSAEHEYTGRFDLRAGLQPAEGSGLDPRLGGKATLLDAKTSGYISAGYFAQTNLYDIAAEECGVGGSPALMILQLRPDGTFREVWVPKDHEWALACLQTYRGAQRVSKFARAA